MGLLDHYRQFEGMADEEVSAELRARAEERRSRALARIEPLDLSATTWHEFPHPDVVAAVTFAARRGINRLSDPGAMELRRELGRRHGLEPERVAVGNGAAELLRSTAAALLEPGDELVTPWPSYPLYPLMARTAGAQAVPVPDGFSPAALLAGTTERTSLVTVCNPNDPTGHHFSPAELRELLTRVPERVTVLLDEALWEYVDDGGDGGSEAVDLLDDFPRLLIFRTFSKVYGLAGLRCGYVLGGPGSEALLERIAPALGVSDVVQAGALEATRECGPLVAARRAQVIAQRTRLGQELADLPVDAGQSQANFLWLAARDLSGSELAARLGRSGVMVHDGAAVGDDRHVRVAVQSDGATNRLLHALRSAFDGR